MTTFVWAAVLVAALLHALWNSLVKSAGDKFMGSARVALWTGIVAVLVGSGRAGAVRGGAALRRRFGVRPRRLFPAGRPALSQRRSVGRLSADARPGAAGRDGDRRRDAARNPRRRRAGRRARAGRRRGDDGALRPRPRANRPRDADRRAGQFGGDRDLFGDRRRGRAARRARRGARLRLQRLVGRADGGALSAGRAGAARQSRRRRNCCAILCATPSPASPRSAATRSSSGR